MAQLFVRRALSTVGAAGIVALALIVVQVAVAETPVSRFSAADQAAARAVVLKQVDLQSGWRGSVEKNAKALTGEDCPGLWEPKQSDLVITGVAKSAFQSGGVRIETVVQVYKTTQMARLDWERTVVHPAVVPCMKRQAAADPDPNARLVSLTNTALPRIANQPASRLRIIADFTPKAGGKPVRVLVDAIQFGRGRTGVSTIFTVPYKDRAAVVADELRVARFIAGRIRA